MKKIIHSLLYYSLFFTSVGCTESSYEDLIPEEYSKVLYIKNSGQNNLDLYNDGSNVDYSFTVIKTGRDPMATAQAKVTVMTQDQIDQDARYKGNNYVVLNQDCYTLRDMGLEFGSSDMYKIINFQLIPDNILAQESAEDNNANSIFILPIRLISDTDAINMEQRDIILKPLVKPLGFQFEKTVTNIDLNVNKEEEIVTEIQISMQSGVINKWDFTADLTVGNQADVDTYNTENNTNYKMIPARAYDTPDPLLFESGYSETFGMLVVKRAELVKGSTYLVPLKLSNSSMETIIPDSKMHYVILQYPLDLVKDKIELNNKLSLPFDIQQVGPINNLTDGNVTTIFATKYGVSCGNPEYGQPFDIKLDKPIQAIMFKYTTRFNNDNATPKVIKLFTSTDGEQWSELTTISSGLPTAAQADYTSIVFTAEQKFSYLRFSVMESKIGICDGSNDNSGDITKFSCWALSDFYLWGM